RLPRRQVGGHPRHGAGGGDHVFGVAAVEGNPGDRAGHTGEEFSAAAVNALPAIAAVPANAHMIARRPAAQAGADGIDDAGHLVTGDARILDSRKNSLFDDRIAVADAAGLDFDPEPSRRRLRDPPFDDFETSLGTRDLGNAP